MFEKTLSLELGGEVPFDDFAETMQHFHRLIELLSQEVGGQSSIAWVIEDLSGGSAAATIRGEAERPETVAGVVRAYSTVGHALERGEVIPYSPRVAEAARNITRVLNGEVTSIRFGTEQDVATIESVAMGQQQNFVYALGSLEGRIETLKSHRGLSFTLYDALNNLAIDCVAEPEQSELLRDAWGRRALVAGRIKRDASSGRPLAINPVEEIEMLPEVQPGSFRKARGIAPAGPDDPPAHVVIRQLRDAW